MLNMFVLLYADDTIVLAENACELQKALDAVHDYCGMYKLTVNIKKLKSSYSLEEKYGVQIWK